MTAATMRMTVGTSMMIAIAATTTIMSVVAMIVSMATATAINESLCVKHIKGILGQTASAWVIGRMI